MPRLPSAADVPQISPRVASDPGVKAPVQAFESPVGIAAEELAPAIEKYAQVARHQENRRDTIDRVDKTNKFNLENEEELRKLNAENDLSREDVLAGYGASLAKRRQQLLQEHAGSNDSRATLAVRLQDVESAAIGRAAGISAKIGTDKVKTALSNALNPIASSVAMNPTFENTNMALVNFDAQFNELKGAFDPMEEKALYQAGREHVALGALNSWIIRGKPEMAESLLIEGGLEKELSPQKQREIRKQIETVRVHRDEKLLEQKIKRPVETAASNAIFKFAVSSEGGVFDADGNVKGLDEIKSGVVQNISAFASRIYADDKTITEAEAVSKARNALGLKQLLRSSVLGRFVSESEIAATAKNRKISVEDVKAQLGIQ